MKIPIIVKVGSVTYDVVSKPFIKILAKAFEDMGLQYDINFKVAAIKKNFEDLEIMLKDLLEVKSSE